MQNILCIIFLGISVEHSAQIVITGMETADEPNEHTILDLQSDSKGLIVPRITNDAMTSLYSTATNGLIIFNTDDKCYYGFQLGDGKI